MNIRSSSAQESESRSVCAFFPVLVPLVPCLVSWHPAAGSEAHARMRVLMHQHCFLGVWRLESRSYLHISADASVSATNQDVITSSRDQCQPSRGVTSLSQKIGQLRRPSWAHTWIRANSAEGAPYASCIVCIKRGHITHERSDERGSGLLKLFCLRSSSTDHSTNVDISPDSCYLTGTCITMTIEQIPRFFLYSHPPPELTLGTLVFGNYADPEGRSALFRG